MGLASTPPFRFRPPAREPTAEERWCLIRAFAPRGTAAPSADASRAVGVARALGLATRIVARHGPSAIREELGEDAVRELMHDYAAALGQAQALARAARVVANAAVEVAASLVLLKGAALVALGDVDDAAREAVDVDVLVAEDRLPALQERLLACGFRSSDAQPADHQAAPLTDPHGAMVELHRFVPGLRAGRSRRDARLGDLERAGGLAALSGWPGRVSVPTRAVLVAHTLVHGIDQHGLSPASYPLARMLADLADLEAAGLALRWGVVEPWVGGGLTRVEAEAAFNMVTALKRGALPASSDAEALLRHVLVAASDPAYSASLSQRAVMAQLASGAPLDRSRLFASVVFPTREQLDAIYGGPRGALGYALLRVWRPFDLGLRLVRHLWRR